jgi:hypothetical protein
MNPFRLIGAGCAVTYLWRMRECLGGPLGWLAAA